MDKRLRLIREVGEEIITEQDLVKLLEEKKNPTAYDGFEPSGQVHIAQGIMRAININKMLEAGCRFKMWVADWHGWANDKLGGDLGRIQVAGKYMVEIWKASGMDINKVEFLWASDVVQDENYWKKVMQVARNSTVKRIVRCSQIMGRKESDSLSAAQIFYPCMQAADIFHLEADIAQLGMDQRKVNMLAREIGPKLGLWKPVAVHHHMLMGLGKPATIETSSVDRAIELKMSKSNPESAIFMTDSEKDIQRKINNAYCPASEIVENPIIEYARYILFEKIKKLKIERPARFGGDLELAGYADLRDAYSKGELHPMDLKSAVSREINKLIYPVRKHFEKGKAKELKDQVESFDVTR